MISSTNCVRSDIILPPIPFTDLSSRKVRPAIVIGKGSFAGDLCVVPLTSQLGNANHVLQDWKSAGLNVPSGIKAQLAMVEARLVLKVLGHLSPSDISALDTQLRRWLEL